MAVDFSHLNAIEARLHNERVRLNAATGASEIAIRTVWVRQLESELTAERAFLGLPNVEIKPMTDDELLAELMAP